MESYQDPYRVTVGVADMKIGQAPQVIETTLGSCVAVCLYAVSKRAGGMVHIVMPYAEEHSPKAQQKRAKYANTAVPELLRRLTSRFGVGSHDCVAKIFGGGRIFKNSALHIGELNEKAVRDHLKICGIKVVASRTGGEKGVRVTFHLETGKVLCQRFGELSEEI